MQAALGLTLQEAENVFAVPYLPLRPIPGRLGQNEEIGMIRGDRGTRW